MLKKNVETKLIQTKKRKEIRWKSLYVLNYYYINNDKNKNQYEKN